MTRQRRRLIYLISSGLLILIALVSYVYREYLGEDTNVNQESELDRFIDQKINGVVTRLATRTINRQPKLDVAYTNLATNEATHLTIGVNYGQTIRAGDTITKDKGERMLLIYQKSGNIVTVPIDGPE